MAPQKTASQVAAINPEAGKILIEDWGFELGTIVCHLYKSSWGDHCECYRAVFDSCSFESWCRQAYKYRYFPMWWADLREKGQRVVVEAFILANETALQAKIDEYYKKQTITVRKTGR